MDDIRESVRERNNEIKNTCPTCKDKYIFIGSRITSKGCINIYQCKCGIVEKLISK